MATNNIKTSPTLNGYSANEDYDALTLIKLIYKEGLLKTNSKKKKIGGVIMKFENERIQMCEVLRLLLIKEPKNLTFSKRQLYYFSQNLHLFKPSIKVLYTYCNDFNMGRVYPAGSLGFATIRKQIRHTFCKGKWIDIDVVNCHCNLLNQMYQGRHVTLNDYCLNRSTYYDKLKQHFTINGQQYLTDDDVCKSYFIICVLYNGSWDTWCAENGLPIGVIVPDFHTEFITEMDLVFQDLLTKHSELASKINQKKEHNLQGSLISWVLQDEERKCLEAMVDYATKEKLIAKTKKDRQVVLAYDGFQIRVNDKINSIFLRKMETFIMEHTGYDLKLTIKPFDKGFTDEELDFELEEPPALDETFDAVEIMTEFLDLPDDKEKAEKICQETFDKFMGCVDNFNDVNCARAIKFLHQGKIEYVSDKEWYYYENKRWIKNDNDIVRSVISSKAFKVFEKIKEACENIDCDDDEELKKKTGLRILKINDEISSKLNNSNSKTNIYKELKEVCLNPDFAKDFNLVKDVLPIKGGLLLNLIDNTTRERTIADKFDFECPVELVNNYENGETYLKSIFADDDETLQVFCDVIKSCVSGRQLRKLFICSGSGRNGKSLLFKKLKKIFGKFMDTLAKSLFVETKSNSSLNTEYEKLDKVRVGYNGEIDDKDKLNQSSVKKISGGDEIDLRTLFKSNYTIVPTANLFLCLNELIEFDKEQAVMDRLVNFPFNAKFPEDASYEAKVDSWIDAIFSYIIVKGKLIDAVVSSPAMILQKEEHTEAQADKVDKFDSLVEFIADRITILEPNNDGSILLKNRKKIVNRDFYNCYVAWCKSNSIFNIPTIVYVGKQMKKYKINIKESNGKIYYMDIDWKLDEDIDEN